MSDKPDIYSDNPEVTLSYKIAVMKAYESGAKLEIYNCEGWVDVKNPVFNWDLYIYRVAPDSKPKRLVAMNKDDYPPVFWYRDKEIPSIHYMAIEICHSGVKSTQMPS